MVTCTFEDGGKGLLRHAVVDTLVLQENKILLVKRTKKLLEGGKWGLVGGYVARDENLKQAVEREIFEETGYKVKGITLLTVRDNPNRPGEDRQNIVFVYFCTALEKTGVPDSESDDQKWFLLSAVPADNEIAFDHADNIKLYQSYLKEEFQLPKLG